MRIVLNTLAIVMICLSSFGQDIHFSQYNLTPLLVNPAQAGAYKNVEVIANYKSQWTSIDPDAYKTMMVCADGRLLQEKWRTKWLSAGVMFFNDQAGPANVQTMQGNLFLGYHMQLNPKNIFGASLEAGFAQRSIDYNKLVWEESTDPKISSGTNSFGYPDFGIGLLYQYTKGQAYAKENDMIIVRAGFAISHLTTPSYSFFNGGEKLYPKITGHVDALIGIKNTKFGLVPGFLYKGQGPASEIFPGCYFRYMISDNTGKVKGGSSIMIGTHLRVKDAFIPSVQFEYGDYTLGMSYDLNTSGFSSATSGKGGFEIALRWGMNPSTAKSSASFD